MAESSCNPLECGDNGFSCGLLQINMTANNVICKDKTLQCHTAFSQPYTCSRSGVCTNVQITNPQLAAQCKTALQFDTSCTVNTAQSLINTDRGLDHWSTYQNVK